MATTQPKGPGGEERDSGEYSIFGVEPGLVFWKGQEIDLSITDQQGLKDLFEQGLPYIKFKKKKISQQ